MVDLFSDRLAYSHKMTQNYFMEKLGLTRKQDAQYIVECDFYLDGQGGLVTILDQSQPEMKQTLYTFEFKESSSAAAFTALMREEVGYWDAYDFFAGENPDREAAKDYEATESAAIRRTWA